MSQEVVLRMENICKSFGGVPVLKDVSLDLFAGEIHALVGENGAGKSVLMKLLMGVYRIDRGKYFVDGKEVRFSDPVDAQQKGISMVYQEFGLVPYLSVGENIFIGRLPLRRGGVINWPMVHAEAQKLLEALGCTHIPPTAVVADLSISDQQEVAIARAFSLQLKVLILDEPTSSLSLAETQRLHERVKMLRSKGLGIIYISHKLDEVLNLADRISVLRDGNMVSTDKTESIDYLTLVERITGHNQRASKEESEAILDQSRENIIELRDFSAPGLFSSVNLTIARGEIVGIGGLVGAGKTELAKAIFGALPAFHRVSGVYRFEGKEVNINSLTPSKAQKMGIALVPENRQDEGLILEQSAHFNVILPNLMKVSKSGVIQGRAATRMSSHAVKDVALRPPNLQKLAKLFSGGNQQKIVIGKWLASGAKLLILDEPTRGVDIGAREEIYELIRKRARQDGFGVLITSSDLSEIMTVCDRILAMSRGRIVGEGLRHQMPLEKLVQLIFMEEPQSGASKAARG